MFLGGGGRCRLSSDRKYNRATTQGQIALRNLNKACTRKTQQYNHDLKQSKLGAWNGGTPKPSQEPRLRCGGVLLPVKETYSRLLVLNALTARVSEITAEIRLHTCVRTGIGIIGHATGSDYSSNFCC